MTNHMWDGYWMLCNGRAWKNLPADVSQIVSRELNRAADEDRQDIAPLELSLRGQLEAKGMQFNTPDTAAFRDVLESPGSTTSGGKTFGKEAWDALESYTGHLG